MEHQMEAGGGCEFGYLEFGVSVNLVFVSRE